MRFLTVLSILFFFGGQSLAQSNVRVHVGQTPHSPKPLEQVGVEALRYNPQTQYHGRLIALLQFEAIPTDEQKAQIAAQGVELMHYIPNNAWVATMPFGMTTTDLQDLGARAIEAIRPEWKMPLPIDEVDHSETYDVRVIRWEEHKQGAYNQRTATTVTGAEMIALAQQSEVQYIELDEGNPTEETIAQQAHRAISTYIANNTAKGYDYTGAGVKIGVHESNQVDPLQNPNFGTRLNRMYESGSTVNGHKTGVGMRMASAGNIDPSDRGTAYGATIYSGGFNFPNAAAAGITILNHSVGWGCSTNATTYNSTSYNYDYWVRLFPTWTMTYSAGNIGATTCYANTAGYGTITGLPKMAKNIFVIGATGHDDVLTGFSSRGPAKDGRVLPTVVAPGDGGTSHASPNVGGVYGQLNQAYREENNNNIPPSGLLKAIIMNTADDIENPGPDFRTGYGSLNARRALELILDDNIITASVSQSNQNTHSIVVPANVDKIKVMVYWTDYMATAGISTRALVNNLDAVLETPSQVTYEPWVLNPAFDSQTLDDPAIRAVDSLNNMEQITLLNPAAGTYTLTVSGTAVPQGPQEYYVVYEFVYDEIVVTHPHGGEQFVPGETERIRWDAMEQSGTFDIDYSLDGGSSWQALANGVNAGQRYYDWTIPSAITHQALIRVQRGSLTGTSDTTFTILGQPENLQHVWTCADSSLFAWDPMSGADGYIVYQLGPNYMDSVAYSSDHTEVLHGLSLNESEWVAVAAVQNGAVSRRTMALERLQGNNNCVPIDAGIASIVRPFGTFMPSCMSSAMGPLRITVRNWGVDALDTIPVAYQINGGPIVRDTLIEHVPSGQSRTVEFTSPLSLNLGTNQLDVWSEVAGDQNASNDQKSQSLDVYNGTSGTVNTSQSFDSFSNCGTGWGCETDVCNLQQGWFNLPNLSGDDIDWRVHNGSTGTGGTGPSGDHTTGTGKYLYLEGSGNGGSGCLNKTARLYSPCYDLNGVNIVEFSLWYHAYGGGIGELHLDVLADGMLVEDVAPPIVGAQGNQWNQWSVDLSDYGDQSLVVIVRGSTGSGWAADLAIDDIKLSAGPAARFDTIVDQDLCLGDTVLLNNTSAYASSYQWNISPAGATFINGTSSTSLHPELVFNTPGTYDIELVATNNVGTDTALQYSAVIVWDQAPDIDISDEYCEGDSVLVSINNGGVPFDLLLNGASIYSGTDSIVGLPNPNDGDVVQASYMVNNTCQLMTNQEVVNRIVLDATVLTTDTTLVAADDTPGTSYQWLDCGSNMQPIDGATDSVFTPAIDGEYSLVVSRGSCADTSACIEFETLVDAVDEFKALGVKIYPNPTRGELTLQLDQVLPDAAISIYGLDGRIMTSRSMGNQKQLRIVLPEQTGVYVIEVKSQTLSQRFRVVRL